MSERYPGEVEYLRRKVKELMAVTDALMPIAVRNLCPHEAETLRQGLVAAARRMRGEKP